ncbi:MAG: preprotein translocase subunit SecG [Bacilli bacterium]|nr:preprotein translocase subunit SecG [Bacillales bacterium]MDY2574537.1 preprotein translocase subunit SecG [Bacilli bacterium]
MEYVLVVISVILILITLLQGGKTNGASGAITGGSKMNIFAKTKERGSEKVLSIMTLILGIIFFLFTLLTKYLG